MLRKIVISACLCLPLLAFTKKQTQEAQAGGTAADRIDYRQMKAPLPRFKVLTSGGKIITDRMVENNANLFVMMFNPTCEHCEAMTQAIEKNIFLFKRSKVVLVAAATMQPYLPDFEKNFKTAQYPTLMVGTDSSKIIDKLFNYNTLPQINIYNHERKLIRTINAQEGIDSLRQYIE